MKAYTELKEPPFKTNTAWTCLLFKISLRKIQNETIASSPHQFCTSYLRKAVAIPLTETGSVIAKGWVGCLCHNINGLKLMACAYFAQDSTAMQ